MLILMWRLYYMGFLLTAVIGVILNGLHYSSAAFYKGDLCKRLSGQRFEVRAGELEEIKFEKSDKFLKPGNFTTGSQLCGIEIFTCHNCHFLITFTGMNLPRCSQGDICGCDYISVRVPEYKKSYVEFCGAHENSSIGYESKTKLISMNFVYGSPFRGTFATQIKALKNVYKISGQLDHYGIRNSGFVESPYFPIPYPSDYSAEYIFTNDDRKKFVQLVFTDFQLSHWSSIVVYDSNGSEIGKFTGDTYRPPVIYSIGHNLTMKFKANDEYPNLGFRVNYFFIGHLGRYSLNKAHTDCGSLIENSGGVIVIQNIVKGTRLQLYDCIWIIRPHPSHGTHLSLQILQFEDAGPKSMLKIHKGVTSKSPLVATVTSSESHGTALNQEYIGQLTTGYYLRLHGYLNNKSRLTFVYTAFKYDPCTEVKDYRCENGRCIKALLHCDGYDHCGDGSDERSCIVFQDFPATFPPENGNWWRTLTPNYYFPKQETSGTGTNTLILITSLAGLGMFIITTTLILIKLHKQRREETGMQQALHTISQDVDTHSHNLDHPAAPPLYDPPPSYEDVIKFYLAPPPTYTSVTGSDTQESSGIENTAFVPDGDQTEPSPTAVMRPPSLLTLVLFPRHVELSNSSASEKQVSNEVAENQKEAFQLNLSVVENNTEHPRCDSLCDKDPSLDLDSVNYPKETQQATIVDKLCTCEGACPCSLHKPVVEAPEDETCVAAALLTTGELTSADSSVSPEGISGADDERVALA